MMNGDAIMQLSKYMAHANKKYPETNIKYHISQICNLHINADVEKGKRKKEEEEITKKVQLLHEQ